MNECQGHIAADHVRCEILLWASLKNVVCLISQGKINPLLVYSLGFYFFLFNINFYLWAQDDFATKGLHLYAPKTLGKWNNIIWLKHIITLKCM